MDSTGAVVSVVGETDLGWCAASAVDETADLDGLPVPIASGRVKYIQADPFVPSHRSYGHPEVVSLRNLLRAKNGLGDVEICHAHEIERAVRIFRRDGFVVIDNVLTSEQLDAWRGASAEVLAQLLSFPGHDGRKYITESKRLPHRYSYGCSSATRHMLHHPVWASMVALPTITPLLDVIFGGMDAYKVWSAGGDVCLPGAIEYQHLHSDLKELHDLPPGRVNAAERMGVPIMRDSAGALTAECTNLIVQHTPPLVTVNFFMSDLRQENGPIRQVPGTHMRADAPPTLLDEPAWMRLSTLVGARAGACVIRDNRAWHGGTPNVSREVRAMPNVEYRPSWTKEGVFTRGMPYDIWTTLSPQARELTSMVVAPEGEVVLSLHAQGSHPAANKRSV